ncbi:MAG: DNA mismatch repair endonuclease MutL, partial [Firmicutes bacterium]|nr:DNA mismatch repair endonuclease MutL [Bacillota bacterium]
IDSGATRIEVRIHDANCEKISVSDNGCGMVPADMVCAMQRHATSKLREFSDLDSLATLGFRGEALPAIASVSEMTVTSKVRGALEAYRMEVRGGKPEQPQPYGAPEGTTILVDRLFYNAPARKKFLKTPTREMAVISDVVTKEALSHPHISFSLYQQGRRLFFHSGSGEYSTAMQSVYGKELMDFMVPVQYSGTVDITGLISLPDLTRPNRNHYLFFVNNRWVKSRELVLMVDEAYRTLLPQHRFPVVLLYLQIDPGWLDVNVHPAKTEIKLRQPQKIKEELTEAIRNALHKKELLAPRLNITLPEKAPKAAAESEKEPAAAPQKPQREQFTTPKFTQPDLYEKLFRQPEIQPKPQPTPQPPAKPKPQPLMTAAEAVRPLTGSSYSKAVVPLIMPDEQPPQLPQDKPAEPASPVVFAPPPVAPQAAVQAADDSDKLVFSRLRPLGQIDLTYIVAAADDGVYFIDQHAAHERVLYERIAAKAKTCGNASQQLAIPLALDFTPAETLLLIDGINNLRDLGFILEFFGDNSFVLRGVPQWYVYSEPDMLLRRLLDIVCDEQVDITHLRADQLFRAACRSAVKANQLLNMTDMVKLFQDLDASPNSATCPHGRPLAIKLTNAEIRKRFLRGGI